MEIIDFFINFYIFKISPTLCMVKKYFPLPLNMAVLRIFTHKLPNLRSCYAQLAEPTL